MDVSSISSISSLLTNDSKVVQKDTNSEIQFTDFLKNALEDVNTTEATVKEDTLKIATGTTDDLHTIMINSAKAELALSLVVQLRNKALDAYNELMRINV